MENYRITIDSNSDLPSFLAEKGEARRKKAAFC